jgi:glycosyltransferase involved in cell wall biosynthesis
MSAPKALRTAVIVPAFNASKTLDAALASIAAQSLPPAEVVVCDDHSTDNTEVVANRWQGLIPITVLRQSENRGPAAARRTAIEHSSAELLALLDADDAWLPDHLELLTKTYHLSGGIVCADALHWYPSDFISSRRHRSHHPIPRTDRQLQAILRNNFVSIGALFPRASYDEIGGFRDGISGAEDWDLWIRLIRNGLRVTGSPSATLLYRFTSTSLSSQPDIFEAYCRVLEWAERDASSLSEKRDATHALRLMRARANLARARRDAENGAVAAARREARLGVGGSFRTSAEAGLFLAFPTLAARLGKAIRKSRR